MDREIDPELPWGCWLRYVDKGPDPHFVDDRTGQTWPSLRSALWTGRLNMADFNRQAPPDLLELIHAALAACARRRPDSADEQADVFQGSGMFQKLFQLWLHSQGLATLAKDGHYFEGLTAEGWAVLHMLAATRPYDVRANRPSHATVQKIVELGLGPEDSEARYARVEEEAIRWNAAFMRKSEAGKPLIVLNQRSSAPVPVLHTVWSLSFPTVAKRNRFYGWLCDRLDRWQAWSDLASEYSSNKLTHHLLAIMAAALEDADPQRAAFPRVELP